MYNNIMSSPESQWWRAHN